MNAEKRFRVFQTIRSTNSTSSTINILEDFTKPLSLSFRLFGNVLADELTITVLTSLVPLVIPLPIMALGIFAGSVQALIFSTLAAAYIAEALE